MNASFNCIATGIGSLPGTDADKAAALSLQYLPEAPIWPQLPQRDFREHMDAQYSEALPGLRIDAARKRFFFDTSGDLTPELETFFGRFIEKDYGFFRISEEYAPGFYALLRALEKGLPAKRGSSKATSPGPLPPAYPLKTRQTGTLSIMTCSSTQWSKGSP